MGRVTAGYHIGLGLGPTALLLAALGLSQVGCPHNPSPTPDGPGGTGGVISTGSGGSQEPGPVPPGDPAKCKSAQVRAEMVCPGAGAAVAEACPKIGGANPGIVDCWTTAPSCDALTACGRPAAGGSTIPHGR